MPLFLPLRSRPIAGHHCLPENVSRTYVIGIAFLFVTALLLVGLVYYVRARQHTVVITVINGTSTNLDSVTVNVFGGSPARLLLTDLAPGKHATVTYTPTGFSSYSMQVQFSKQPTLYVEERLASGGLRSTETIGTTNSHFDYDWLSGAYYESVQFDHPILTFPIRAALGVKK